LRRCRSLAADNGVLAWLASALLRANDALPALLLPADQTASLSQRSRGALPAGAAAAGAVRP
jgi:hypothetical protein